MSETSPSPSPSYLSLNRGRSEIIRIKGVLEYVPTGDAGLDLDAEHKRTRQLPMQGVGLSRGGGKAELEECTTVLP